MSTMNSRACSPDDAESFDSARDDDESSFSSSSSEDDKPANRHEDNRGPPFSTKSPAQNDQAPLEAKLKQASDTNTNASTALELSDIVRMQPETNPAHHSPSSAMQKKRRAKDAFKDSKKSHGLLQAKWDEMFTRLVVYKAKYGNCLVPNRYKGDASLGAWVSTQRRQYKILTTGSYESTPMTPERAQRLESLGFVWATKDPRHVPWERRFQELVAFKRQFGHCSVPIGYERNVKLANWVSTQRQEAKLFREGRSSRLDAKMIASLESIGFVWKASRGISNKVNRIVIAEGEDGNTRTATDRDNHTATSHASLQTLTSPCDTIWSTPPAIRMQATANAHMNNILRSQIDTSNRAVFHRLGVFGHQQGSSRKQPTLGLLNDSSFMAFLRRNNLPPMSPALALALAQQHLQASEDEASLLFQRLVALQRNSITPEVPNPPFQFNSPYGAALALGLGGDTYNASATAAQQAAPRPGLLIDWSTPGWSQQGGSNINILLENLARASHERDNLAMIDSLLATSMIRQQQIHPTLASTSGIRSGGSPSSLLLRAGGGEMASTSSSDITASSVILRQQQQPTIMPPYSLLRDVETVNERFLDNHLVRASTATRPSGDGENQQRSGTGRNNSTRTTGPAIGPAHQGQFKKQSRK